MGEDPEEVSKRKNHSGRWWVGVEGRNKSECKSKEKVSFWRIIKVVSFSPFRSEYAAINI